MVFMVFLVRAGGLEMKGSAWFDFRCFFCPERSYKVGPKTSK